METRHEDADPVIIVVGELDISGTEQFWAHVSEAIEARPVSLAIDARGLPFVDSSGLAAMVRAREVATEAGVELRVTDPSPPLRRIVEFAVSRTCCWTGDNRVGEFETFGFPAPRGGSQ